MLSSQRKQQILAILAAEKPVSYTHLTLPTID